MNENLPSLTNILDNIDIGISIFDSQGKFLFVNRSVLNISGRSRKEYDGKTVYDFQKQGILNKPVVSIVYETKKPVARIQESVTKTGQVRKYLVRATPIFDSEGEIIYAIADRIELEKLQADFDLALKHSGKSNFNHIEYTHTQEKDIIYKSSAMKAILSDANKVAAIDSSVLLQGESGTGKEVIAQYIHKKSKRSAKKMIEINCGSMPETLLESELFGYDKGAFTGALQTGKIGLIESADQGILFLDEVNSMPMTLQTKLLRVLETKAIVRLGSTISKPVDFRIIAASNVDLKDCVKKGSFREDLYYRLNVIPIKIPPLRERKKDIVPLSDYFLDVFCNKYDLKKQFSKKIYKTMELYDWPGNVRELRNFVERMVVMSDSQTVKISEIPKDMLQNEPCADTEKHDVFHLKDEKEQIVKALELHHGHRQNTADFLGISRRTLQYKLKKYHIV